MRRLSLLLLITLVSGAAQAALLYRWVEADGSVTFSSDRPPAGIAYETMGDNLKPVASITPASGDNDASATPSGTAMKPGAAATIDTPREPAAARPAARRTDGTTEERQQKCSELQKRVVSLERRLRNALSDIEMDNTVIYMAQYQQSIDRHCADVPGLFAAQ